MSWTKAYWDIVDDFYWVPSYIGLKSIPRKSWEITGDRVAIPRAVTNPNGPLYSRKLSEEDYWPYIRRQEETFNHIFNLALATMPGDVVSDVFAPFISASTTNSIELQEKSLARSYETMDNEQVVDPDAFLLSEKSLLAIELKFNAPTTIHQLAKYVALLAAEELKRGPRQFVDLLYIFPSEPESKFAKQTSIPPAEVGPEHFTLLRDSVSNRTIQAFLTREHRAAKSMLSRMSVSCITWADLATRLESYERSLGSTPGDRTLKRLISGLASEIYAHPLSRAKPPDESQRARQEP